MVNITVEFGNSDFQFLEQQSYQKDETECIVPFSFSKIQFRQVLESDV